MKTRLWCLLLCYLRLTVAETGLQILWLFECIATYFDYEFTVCVFNSLWATVNNRNCHLNVSSPKYDFNVWGKAQHLSCSGSALPPDSCVLIQWKHTDDEAVERKAAASPSCCYRLSTEARSSCVQKTQRGGSKTCYSKCFTSIRHLFEVWFSPFEQDT